MNTLQDFGRWGGNLLGEAQNQLAPAAASATSLASSTFKSGADLVRSGAKTVSNTVKTNIGSAVAAKHTLEDPQGGTRSVTEVSFLAEGAFGAVLKVKDNSGTEYALKRIACQEGVQIASSLEAAENEVKILVSLPPHSHIIRCFGSHVDRHPGGGSATVKLLLELCPGGTLLDYMDGKGGKLGAKEVVHPFSQITDAVRHMHAQTPPIQHRDLKVENVLMGTDGQWKLCDFGSCSTEVVPPKELSRARFMSLQEEIDKTVTMLYRPPEMADIELNYRNGYTINTQVDVWMLGCILYTLAFYRHPFQDCPTAMAISNGKYFIPDDHPLGKSQKLCGLIHWLLAKDPKDRPTATRLIELLQNLGKCQYADLFSMMPEAVQEKIRKLEALFSKRKDIGDVPLPPAAAALLAASGSSGLVASTATASSPSKTQGHQKRPPSGGNSGYPGNGASRQQSPPNDGSANDSGFDLMSALAPSGPQAAASSANVASVPSGTTPPAPQEDLLSFSAPAPVAHPVPSGGGAPVEDLLGFGALEPAASSGAPVADFANFANFASAPAAPPLGGFNAAPGPSPVTPNPGVVTTGDLIGFDFVDPFAPSTAQASAPLHAPTAQNCSGSARAAAPQPADTAASFNLLDLP